MVFYLHKFKHYLLGNKFVFDVNHIALVYLVNKPQVLGRIIKWLLLFIEYEFTVLYKPSKTHVFVDALLRLPNITKPTGVLDKTIDASMLYTKSKWLNHVQEFLKIGQIEGTLSTTRNHVIKPLCLTNQIDFGWFVIMQTTNYQYKWV